MQNVVRRKRLVEIRRGQVEFIVFPQPLFQLVRHLQIADEFVAVRRRITSLDILHNVFVALRQYIKRNCRTGSGRAAVGVIRATTSSAPLTPCARAAIPSVNENAAVRRSKK